jgi:hypothetical protein
MRFRTVALALALACSFTASVEAKRKTVVKRHVKIRKAPKAGAKVRKQKIRRTA